MRSFLSNLTARLRRDQRGATAVEYGIMVSLIAVVIIVAVTMLGNNLVTTFNGVACSVKGGSMAVAAGAPTGTAATCSK
jgi:pilus assembly protein Flp/PilA